MNRPAVVMSVVLLLALSVGCAGEVAVRPTAPPSLAVTVSAGQLALPDGGKVGVAATTLTVDGPATVEKTVELPVPGDWAAHWDNWQPWPGKWQNHTLAVSLKPSHDEQGTPILGGLFRQIDPASVKVNSLDGSKTFKAGEDYRYNEGWAQIGNVGGRLGAPGGKLKVSYTLTLQRLDLVQVGRDGKVSIKKGESRIVCPQLPQPDAGCAAVAGVYVAPWPAGGNPNYAEGKVPRVAGHAVTEHEILVVRPAPPVAPINPKAVAKTVARLTSGQEATIAFMGASITLGAEAPQWWGNLWTEENLGYPSRTIVALRQRFPRATVTPVGAFRGGTTTKYGLEVMEKDVLPKKPDLVLIAFGGNDVAGPVGGKPKNPPDQYKEDMRTLVKRAKAAGAEVMLVVVMQQFPWGEAAERWPTYRQKLLELGREEDVAVADVYTEWMNQATRGTPPFTQLHNWINHPGAEGHKVYADVILRFFE